MVTTFKTYDLGRRDVTKVLYPPYMVSEHSVPRIGVNAVLPPIPPNVPNAQPRRADAPDSPIGSVSATSRVTPAMVDRGVEKLARLYPGIYGTIKSADPSMSVRLAVRAILEAAIDA